MKTFYIDRNKSKASWEVKRNGNSLGGKVNFKEGRLISELKSLMKGVVKIDLKSIEINKHQIDDDKREQLIKDIKSAKVLDVETFPTADLRFDSDRTGQKAKTRGIILFKGNAYSFSFPLKLTESENEVRIKSQFSIGSVSLPLLDEILAYSDKPADIRCIELVLDLWAAKRSKN
jgi:polyisoprenoid-binding protein YceI